MEFIKMLLFLISGLLTVITLLLLGTLKEAYQQPIDTLHKNQFKRIHQVTGVFILLTIISWTICSHL